MLTVQQTRKLTVPTIHFIALNQTGIHAYLSIVQCSVNIPSLTHYVLILLGNEILCFFKIDQCLVQIPSEKKNLLLIFSNVWFFPLFAIFFVTPLLKYCFFSPELFANPLSLTQLFASHYHLYGIRMHIFQNLSTQAVYTGVVELKSLIVVLPQV